MNMQRFYFPALTLLSLVGIVVSVISVYHFAGAYYGFSSGPSFCNINSTFNCDAVNQTQYAFFLGMPVASLGLFFYGWLFFFSLAATGDKWLSGESRGVVALLSLFASLFSIYLAWVSWSRIGVLCPTCLALYVVNFLLLALSIPHFSKIKLSGILKESFSRPIIIPLTLVGLAFSLALPRLIERGVSKEEISAREFAISKSGLLKDPIKGDGKITIVEFADFECPACKSYARILASVYEEFKDSIQIIHKQFPLDNSCNPQIPQPFHAHSCYASLMALCAGEQDKYWGMYDFIFETLANKKTFTETRAALKEGAKVLGLDLDSFNECVETARYMPKIQADIEEAVKVGLEGTPTVFVNGKKLGNLTREALVQAIKDEM
jgi:protein-disulfide isomerase/uncharacterized membrane protein